MPTTWGTVLCIWGDPAPLLWRHTFSITGKGQLYKDQELKLTISNFNMLSVLPIQYLERKHHEVVVEKIFSTICHMEGVEI